MHFIVPVVRRRLPGRCEYADTRSGAWAMRNILRRRITDPSVGELRGPSLHVDELLVAAVGDGDSLRDFYVLTVQEVIRFFRQRVFDDDLARDLTAETYAALLIGLRRFDPARGSAMQYLFGIANKQFLMWRRRGEVSRRHQQRAGIRLSASASPIEDDIVEQLDRDWLAAKVQLALDKLKPHERAAVTLRIIDQLPYDEVARRLECNEGAARVRVSRALARLHDSFAAVSAE